MIFFEDSYFWYIRKPYMFASVPGKIISIIDLVWSEEYHSTYPLLKKLYEHQTQYFNLSQEYWLCNRLDNKTSGLLIFAKNPTILAYYHQAQKNGIVYKNYIADIVWKYHHHNDVIVMHRIGHHPTDVRKMIQLDYESNPIYHTHIRPLYYDPDTNRTTLSIYIRTWRRHQIRLHLKSLGYIIVWEDLYISPKLKKNIWIWTYYHLRYIGLHIG